MASRFENEVRRLEKAADAAQAAMRAACEHYATAIGALSVARERLEREQEAASDGASEDMSNACRQRWNPKGLDAAYAAHQAEDRFDDEAGWYE